MDLRHENSTENGITTTETQVNPTLLLRAAVEAPPPGEEPSTSHGIRWLEGTVDNEFLGRKKSNCCCIYKKPRRWDESSSSSSSSDSSDNENDGNKPVRHTHCTEHCRGHTKHCYRKKTAQPTESQQEIQPPVHPTPDGLNNPSPNPSVST